VGELGLVRDVDQAGVVDPGRRRRLRWCFRSGLEMGVSCDAVRDRCPGGDAAQPHRDGGDVERVEDELDAAPDQNGVAEHPLSILTWLYTRKGKTESPETLQRQLGRGEIVLTHEAFHTPCVPGGPPRICVSCSWVCDVLPRIDKQSCLFERWLIAHHDTITDPAHAQLIHRFATWEVLPNFGPAPRTSR
jgi:hypothetical protein